MYANYYIFFIPFYITKLTYRAYTMQLEGNLNIFKLSLSIYFGEEYHYTLRFIRWIHTFNLRLKNGKYGLQSMYAYERKK